MAPDLVKIDVKDRKILYQLDLNCRQSLNEIAKKVGLSKQVVAYRIKRLEETGVVRGYITTMDMTKLGFYTWRIYIKFLNPTVESVNEITNYLKKHKHIAYVVETYGIWDVVFAFVNRSIEEFHTDWREFLSLYRDHVHSKDISYLSELYQFRHGYIVNLQQSDAPYDVLASPPKQNVAFDGDKLDWNILKAIAGNSRAELQAIGQQVNLSAKAVSYRLKNMKKRGVIQSYRALMEESMLGYDVYKVFIGLRSLTKQKEAELFTWLRMSPNVLHVTKAIAQADYEFELHASGREDFWRIMNELRTKFKDIITTVSTLQYAKVHKVLHIPEVTPV